MTLRLVFHFVLVVMLLVTIGLSELLSQSNSQQLVANDRLGQYEVIKGMIDPRRTAKYPTGRQPGNLGTCGDMELALGLMPQPHRRSGEPIEMGERRRRGVASQKFDATTAALVRIAGHYYKWEHELPRLGYPKEIVMPLIAEVEKRLLERVPLNESDIFQETISREAIRLAKELNAAAAKRHLRATKVYFDDDCGGGGILTEFKIPKGARYFFTSEFFVRLCRVQGYDPFDRSACNRWDEVLDGWTLMMAGYYDYIAEYDGDRRIGRFNAEALNGVFRLAK